MPKYATPTDATADQPATAQIIPFPVRPDQRPDANQARDRLARALASLDRFDTHLLIRPGAGTAGDPARIADLIKKIGGFRIGSMPTFAHAASTKDPVDALRRLAPYAQAMEATVKAFGKSGTHEAWDLARLFGAAEAAGYQSTMCIDYAAKTDPVGTIDRARDLLAALIDPVDEDEAAEDAVEEGD